jgi:hypothetical protein
MRQHVAAFEKRRTLRKRAFASDLSAASPSGGAGVTRELSWKESLSFLKPKIAERFFKSPSNGDVGTKGA